MARVVETPHPSDRKTASKPISTDIAQTEAHNASPVMKEADWKRFKAFPPCLHLATEDFEIMAALKLIAASVAEQRQQAAKHLISHTLFLVPIAVIVLWANKKIYEDPSSWLYTIVQSATALSTVLLILKRLVDGYLDEAARVGTIKWLYGNYPGIETTRDNEQTDPAFTSENGTTFVLVYRFKMRIIGVLVMSTVSRDDQSGTYASARPTAKKYEAFIRAWTVESAFRGHGVGGELLNQAVKMCHPKGWQGPRFANAHANSLRVLPRSFHGDMDKASELWASYLAARVEANKDEWDAHVRRCMLPDDMPSEVIPGDRKRRTGNTFLNELTEDFAACSWQTFEASLEKAVEAQNRWKAAV
ncbi:Acyl-CoA N-acyltransferase [Penicillium sp. DV-2018c]|nr:Acyl-CoA N-acyltransferase [Penicillium sp. DV-2018c]KAJ5582850.1 Acyl-CoA N-acyltransferase [Penicillium sp. DV-2018c]